MPPLLPGAGLLLPAILMLCCVPLALTLTLTPGRAAATVWRGCHALSLLALACTLANLLAGPAHGFAAPWLRSTGLGLACALLVQLIGTVIVRFSARYLDGEAGQRRYAAALGGVLAAVHLLLLADHWLVLIAAWALAGAALQHLLCFYPDRPFALLAAHKKQIADRAADLLLAAAAILAWNATGSGALPDLWAQLAREGMSPALHLSALCLAAAVILRSALLPVHGWLIQVMEAPTPVSALLHAGVVNLGGYVLIRFAPLLDQAAPARILLLAFGLATAVLAGLVMLTRISIKVRLAWSTVAQMGFMLLECALGLYTLAALHLVGHSLYKAHAFLSASSVVRQTRLQALYRAAPPSAPSVLLAPLAAAATLLLLQRAGAGAWPWWWSATLGLAWAPLLWLPAAGGARQAWRQAVAGIAMIAGLGALALLAHRLPLGVQDAPRQAAGSVALAGMAALYLCLALLQRRPQALQAWRRWSYAGFYVDEIYTRLALWVWPAGWIPKRDLLPALNPSETAP